MSRKLKPEYESDFYEWLMYSAKLLRGRKINELDFEHLAEEIESVGASEKREIRNRLVVLIMHLLKWQFQAVRRSDSWRRTIIDQRDSIELVLKDSPSLRPRLQQFIEEAYYPSAVHQAVEETGMIESVFPKICPYTLEQIFDKHFYPGEA